MGKRSARKPAATGRAKRDQTRIHFTLAPPSQAIYRTLRETHDMHALHNDFLTVPRLLTQYPDWPKIKHYACTLFSHASFNEDTLDRLENWLLAEHCRSKIEMWMMKLPDVVTRLRDEIEKSSKAKRRDRRRDTDPVADAAGCLSAADLAAKHKLPAEALARRLERLAAKQLLRLARSARRGRERAEVPL